MQASRETPGDEEEVEGCKNGGGRQAGCCCIQLRVTQWRSLSGPLYPRAHKCTGDRTLHASTHTYSVVSQTHHIKSHDYLGLFLNLPLLNHRVYESQMHPSQAPTLFFNCVPLYLSFLPSSLQTKAPSVFVCVCVSARVLACIYLCD